jgi:hypothetical protein
VAGAELEPSDAVATMRPIAVGTKNRPTDMEPTMEKAVAMLAATPVSQRRTGCRTGTRLRSAAHTGTAKTNRTRPPLTSSSVAVPKVVAPDDKDEVLEDEEAVL